MPWCHLLLSMPVIGLTVFLFLPLPVAAPIYAVVSAISLWMYSKIVQALHRPVVTGAAGLIGAEALIVSQAGRTGVVRCHGKLWTASFDGEFRPGERARITGVKGLQVIACSGLDGGEHDA